jgi:hypothetical protein
MMHPLNYENLVKDQEYLFFLRSLSPQIGFFGEKPFEEARERIRKLIGKLVTELYKLRR